MHDKANELTESTFRYPHLAGAEVWMSQAEAARVRGVTRQSIHRMTRKGKLRSMEFAGRKLVLREDVVGYEAGKGGRPRKGAPR